MFKQLLSGRTKRVQQVSTVLVIVLVAAVGTYLLSASHAASPYVSLDAASGNVTAGASKQACAGASNSQCVVFGNSASAANVKPTVAGHQLQLGTTGNRLKMRGVAVWGIEDQVTGSFGAGEYNSRQTIVNTVKAWGGNEIRLRVLAADYNNQTYMTKAQELQEIKDWQTAAQAAGLYLDITWWDSLDGSYNDANWAADYSQAFPMMTDVINTLGASNPWVIYEPFNEPNNVSESAWLTAMTNTVKLFRSDNYTGILLLDTDGWSHVYNDADMTSLENTDSGLAGMGGKNQIIFAKHDYANEGFANPDSGFDSSHWPSNDDGSTSWDFTKHLVWETEFGNYNGSASTEHLAWSAGAASWMAAKVNDGTLAGATAFLYGPWYDANAITGSDNATPTQWGGYVKTDFLAQVN